MSIVGTNIWRVFLGQKNMSDDTKEAFISRLHSFFQVLSHRDESDFDVESCDELSTCCLYVVQPFRTSSVSEYCRRKYS